MLKRLLAAQAHRSIAEHSTSLSGGGTAGISDLTQECWGDKSVDTPNSGHSSTVSLEATSNTSTYTSAQEPEPQLHSGKASKGWPTQVLSAALPPAPTGAQLPLLWSLSRVATGIAICMLGHLM